MLTRSNISRLSSNPSASMRRCPHVTTIAGTLCPLLFASSAAPTLADDINPPPWRGSPGWTFQHWNFPTNNVPAQPDVPYVSPGLPLLANTSEADWHWTDPFGTTNKTGIWELRPTPPPSFLEFHIPNIQDDLNPKEIWIQVKWQGFRPAIDIQAQVPGGGIAQAGNLAPPVDVPAPNGNGWMHTTYQMGFSFCPPMEVVRLNGSGAGSVYIDQVVVDTRCVPEPTTAALGLFSAVPLIASQRFRRRARRVA